MGTARSAAAIPVYRTDDVMTFFRKEMPILEQHKKVSKVTGREREPATRLRLRYGAFRASSNDVSTPYHSTTQVERGTCRSATGLSNDSSEQTGRFIRQQPPFSDLAIAPSLTDQTGG